tara:strand:- start:103 stop:357 length:255 start_codon:yes stop_codon:yes gene_type:complete
MSRSELKATQEVINNAESELQRLCEKNFPIDAEVEFHILANQKYASEGVVIWHMNECVGVRMNNRKKTIKRVHWSNIINVYPAH